MKVNAFDFGEELIVQSFQIRSKNSGLISDSFINSKRVLDWCRQ